MWIFYSGILYLELGIHESCIPLIFALARSAGWIAHYYEKTPLIRPRLVYQGAAPRALPTTDE